jgi:hypothetical protein
METPQARERVPGSVRVPLGEVLRVAGEYQRGGCLDDAKRLLDRALAVLPNQRDARILPESPHIAAVIRSLTLMERALAHGIDTPLHLRNICEIYRTSAAWTRHWRPPAAPPR